MTLLHLLSYVAAIAGCLFVTLSLASGLLWLSELIEEHSKMAKMVGIRAIYAVILIDVALYLFDSLPFKLTVFSIICHLVYLQNFSITWPYISLVSPSFIGSCCLVIIDHFLWFHYFAQKTQDARRLQSGRLIPQGDVYANVPGFMDIAAFFGICVWLVPLFLFLSLSANDNALPTSLGSVPPTPINGGHTDLGSPPAASKRFQFPRKSLLAGIVDPIFNAFPALRLRRASRRNPEGLIAPRTPTRSPLHTPVLNGMSLPPWSSNGNGEAGMDMLSPPVGYEMKGMGGEPRRSSVTTLRSPPVRRSTAPTLAPLALRVSGETDRSEEGDPRRPGLGIRSHSRLGRRAVNGDEDSNISRATSPIEP